jgi:osmotically-inducible protein OsmY
MRDDRTLQADVMRELEWDPAVEAAHIGVSARDGSITLNGKVSSYSERVHAVKAAERVYGVRAVADELEIELPREAARDDSDVAAAIAHALRWNNRVPDTVEAEVWRGLVTLRGSVRWPFQRDEAMRVVRGVTGVRGVTDAIEVEPRVAAPDVVDRIREALERAANVDAGRIHVRLEDGIAVLEGEVHTLAEARAVRNVVSAAPGVTGLDDRLAVVV